jgi:hypothetical protein
MSGIVDVIRRERPLRLRLQHKLLRAWAEQAAEVFEGNASRQM